MTRTIHTRKLTREAFAPFGDVISKAGITERIPFNAGRAHRLPPLGSATTLGEGSKIAITLAETTPYSIPLRVEFVERHPFGSQAFMPLTAAPFLVVVCPDEGGKPGTPLAFLTAPFEGVNYHPNVWHGILTPLEAGQDFLIVDRFGGGTNLEEYTFDEPWIIERN